MSHKEIEVILARHLASYLAIPIFIVDTQGTMVYYNEAAETLLGQRFEETGEMPIGVWSTAFKPTDESGAPFATEALPLAVALNKQQTNNARFWIRGLDEVRHHIEVTAFPLIGQENRYLGALALFWEVPS